jgi:hypothetical protein
MVRMTYKCNGNTIHLDNEIHGFINKEGKIKLVNIETDKVLDEYFDIEYIMKDVIVLDKIDLTYREARIINRKTFEPILVTDYRLRVCEDLIYTEKTLLSQLKVPMKLYSTTGKIVFETIASIETSVGNIPDTNLYAIINKLQDSFKEQLIIVYYDKDKEECTELFNSIEWQIENISDNKYMFSSYNDFSIAYIIDLKEVNKNRSKITFE